MGPLSEAVSGRKGALCRLWGTSARKERYPEVAWKSGPLGQATNVLKNVGLSFGSFLGQVTKMLNDSPGNHFDQFQRQATKMPKTTAQI